MIYIYYIIYNEIGETRILYWKYSIRVLPVYHIVMIIGNGINNHSKFI